MLSKMLNKKIIAFAGMSVIAVALLAGVTYAWFTNTQSDVIPGTITAGKLGIEFYVTEPTETPQPLYPQLTLEDGTPDTSGLIPDVAEKTITLRNDSDRQVLVKISGAGLEVMGSEIQEESPYNVIEETRGITPLTNTDALKFLYTPDDLTINYTKINEDLYILLPEGSSELNVDVQVWIDGGNSGNEYQNATITFNEMTATAVQYRKAAIAGTFTELLEDDLLEIEGLFGSFE